jgi:hypothetical protein
MEMEELEDSSASYKVEFSAFQQQTTPTGHSRFLRMMDTSAVERIREEENEESDKDEQSFLFLDTSQIPPNQSNVIDFDDDIEGYIDPAEACLLKPGEVSSNHTCRDSES